MDIDIQSNNSDESVNYNLTTMFDKNQKKIKATNYNKYAWDALKHHNAYLIEEKKTKWKYNTIENTNIDECEKCGKLTIRNYKSWHQNMIFCRKHSRWIHWKCTGKSYEYLVACAKGENRFDCC